MPTNNLEKRLQNVEQAAKGLGRNPAAIAEYCQQHDINYRAGQPIILLSVPADMEPERPNRLSQEAAQRHADQLESMGANVLHINLIYPDIAPELDDDDSSDD